MLSEKELSVGQSKWLALVKAKFNNIYKSSTVTHAQLKEMHEEFVKLRTVDKKYKVGWPIWLITNNAVSRGVYSLPAAAVEKTPINPVYSEYEEELEAFGIK